MTLFDDIIVPLYHPWVADLRLPIISGFNPSYSYPVTLAIPTGETSVYGYKFVMPSEAEAQIVAAYNALRSDRWFDQRYVDSVIRKNILDIDPGVNTHSFGKTSDRGWLYRACTWQHPAWPLFGSDLRFDSVVELIDHAVRDDKRWAEFKLNNAELIASA